MARRLPARTMTAGAGSHHDARCTNPKLRVIWAAAARDLASAAIAYADKAKSGGRKLRVADKALIRWGFNTKQRSQPPGEVAEVLAWVSRNSVPVSALAEAATTRRIVDQATDRLDGKTAAASTARRNRITLANAMDYAVELACLTPIRFGLSSGQRPRCPTRWTGAAS